MLRISLAKLLHRLPDEIDTVDYEDCLRIAIHCDIENQQMEAARNDASSGRAGVRTERHVFTKKPKANRR